MACISSSIYGDVVADVLHQASDGGFSTSSDELDRRARAWVVPTPTTGALEAIVVGGKLQAFELREFAAMGKLVKVKALSKLSDAAKKAAPKDTAKPKKTAAADKPNNNKVTTAGLAVAWCFVTGLIFFSSLHRNPAVPHQQAGVGPSCAGDGAAGGGGGISRSDFPPAMKLLDSMVGPTYQSWGPQEPRAQHARARHHTQQRSVSCMQVSAQGEVCGGGCAFVNSSQPQNLLLSFVASTAAAASCLLSVHVLFFFFFFLVICSLWSSRLLLQRDGYFFGV